MYSSCQLVVITIYNIHISICIYIHFNILLFQDWVSKYYDSICIYLPFKLFRDSVSQYYVHHIMFTVLGSLV